MPVTMRDVAEQAGVSIKTVSRVVNDQGEISAATRDKVLAVINALGYRPSRVARSLVTQRSQTIGFIIPDITNPFFPEVARGVQDEARTNDINVFMCNSDESPTEHLQLLHSLADQGVDGIVLFSSLISNEALNKFADSFRPIVTINRLGDHPSISKIIVDNYRGAQLAVNHLVDRSHTAIGMLSGQAGISVSQIRRVDGFRDALKGRGLPINEDWIVKVAGTMSGGRDAARQLLTQHPEITALFAYNDLLAIGALRACSELGRRVPDDCAIVGFDDIQLAAMVTPALTSVHYDKYDLGRQTMARLLEMINNPEQEFSTINLDVELIVREST